MQESAAAPHARPRAVLYLRQSTYREESVSLELQESAGREYCTRMGYVVTAVKEDPGISGRTMNRKGVRAALQLIENHDADVIVVWKWSRLSRARLDMAVAIDAVESAGGRVESATESVDTQTATGRLARGMLSEFAAFESERIGDVWKEILRRRNLSGVPGTGGDRFGYIRTEKNTYEPDPVTGPLLAEMYHRYVNLEHGWARIVRWLNEEGHTTLRGTKWDGSKARSILDAGFGAGFLAIGYRSKNVTYLPGNQPPIIDADLWERYLAKRAAAPRPPRSVDPVSPLSGLLRCADCKGPMVVGLRMLNHQGVRGFWCSNARRFQDGRRGVSCYEHNALDAVHEWVNGLAEDVDQLAAARMQLEARRVRSIDDSAAIQKRIDSLTADLGRLTVRYVSDKISETAYKAAEAELDAQINDLQKRKRVEAEGSRAEVDLRNLAVHVSEMWDDMTPMELRTMLSKLVKYVYVIPPEKGRGHRVGFDPVEAWSDRS